MTEQQWKHGALVNIAESMAKLNTLAESERGALLRDLHAQAADIARQCKGMIQQIEDAALEHIIATGEDIELSGTARWTIGKTKKVRSFDDRAVLEAVLRAAGGDVAKLTTGDEGVLVSQPWKVGAVRSLIGDESFAALFSTEYGDKLVLKVLDEFALAKKGGRR